MSEQMNIIRFNYTGDPSILLAKSWVTDNTDTTKNTVVIDGEPTTVLWRTITYSINNGETTINGVFKVQVKEDGKPDAHPIYENISGEPVIIVEYDERGDLLLMIVAAGAGYFTNFSTAEENVEYVDSMEGTTTCSYVNSTSQINKYAIELYVNSDVTAFPYGIFSSDTNLNSIIFYTYSITDIEGDFASIQGAFRGCENLTSVTLPNTLTSIGEMALSFCTSLTSLIIPDGVTSIGKNAFRGSSSLAKIASMREVPPTIGEMTFDDISNSAILYVPQGCVSAYSDCSIYFSDIVEGTPVTITASTSDGGTITPLGETTLYEGFDIPYLLFPFEGYEIESVLVDDVDVTTQISNNIYTFEEVEGNHTISVKYRSTTPPEPPVPPTPPVPPSKNYGFNLSGMKNVDYAQQGVIILRN